ncbi:RNA 2',3'-cyclic phosphodiesterase [Acidobacterium sp. S8]|uniref:RNA 2',3'-cyclic phosphodiesterase n=1 Tax=Acidobacterium sp. S8 TaxID=1641854 RepID=UPI00131DD45C|nr:RNA 2',3'-cyclic phosphodiesterase [Acidobacterium sp. S8]
MRLFTGIAIPDETRPLVEACVHPLQEEFPHLRWSLSEQWHVTLQFLGETDEAHYTCIVEQMRRVSATAAEIELLDPGFFARAGAFFIAVRLTSSLLTLHDRTAEGLKICGFEPEARAYNPHITLARRKGRSESPDFVKLQKRMRGQLAFESLTFAAKEFLLYQSTTGPAGARYEVRERFPLM